MTAMLNDLKACADCLQDAEEQLTAFLSSSNSDSEERSNIAVALSFVQEAGKAIAEPRFQKANA